MGFFGMFNNKNKSFDLEVSDATNVVNIITEADMHSYELSQAELRFEMQELALLNDAKDNALKAINFIERQLVHNTLTKDRLNHIYDLLKISLTSVKRLEQSTTSYKRFAEEIVEFVSKSEDVIRKYLKDKGHDEAVELRWVHKREVEIIEKTLTFADLLKDLNLNITALVNLLSSIKMGDVDSVKSNLSKIKSLSSAIEHKFNDVEDILNNMRRINKKVAHKLQRIINLDHLLGRDLNKFMAEVEANQPMYKGGHI